MGPGETLVVLALFVILPAIIMRGIRDIKAAKYASRNGTGAELRASDLRQLVREAADEAVAPLAARVADLEERLGDESVASLRSRLDPALVADAMEHHLAPSFESDGASGARQRTR